jgi:hypothetical protein
MFGHQRAVKATKKLGNQVGMAGEQACNSFNLWSRLTLCNITGLMMNKQLLGNKCIRAAARKKKEEGCSKEEI